MAQDRYYLLPLQGDGLSPKTAFVPKYRELIPPTVGFTAFFHGGENASLVTVLNLDDKIHDQIAKQTDVFVFPPFTDFVDVDSLKTALPNFFFSTKFLDSSQKYSDLHAAILAQLRYSELTRLETGKKLFSDPHDAEKEVTLTDTIDSLHPDKADALNALNVKYAYPALKEGQTFDDLLSAVVEERVVLPPKIDGEISAILDVK